jgi:osmotically-inducible protein OsmY
VFETPSRAAQPGYADFNEFDRALVNRVREAIRENPELKGVEPSLVIVSENGTVTLHGIVASAAERSAVETRAREASGVVNVVNYLETTPVPAIQVPATATGGAETP